MDYYSLLGVPRSADDQEIKKAYRRLAREYHPDKTGNDKHKTVLFQAISEAYEVLSDPQNRQLYDLGEWPPKKAKNANPEPATQQAEPELARSMLYGALAEGGKAIDPHLDRMAQKGGFWAVGAELLRGAAQGIGVAAKNQLDQDPANPTASSPPPRGRAPR
jgi:curved DNA-binding protein CbpA